MRIILANWLYARDRIRRQFCSLMGLEYRTSKAYIDRPYGLDSMRRVEWNGENARKWQYGQFSPIVGSETRETSRRTTQGAYEMDHRVSLGASTSVNISTRPV